MPPSVNRNSRYNAFIGGQGFAGSPAEAGEDMLLAKEMSAPQRRSSSIKGLTGDWEMVIGMEVHAQVTSQSKLFSGASTSFG